MVRCWPAATNMAFLDDLLGKLGAVYDRAHLFTFSKVSAPGVTVRWERDGRPPPAAGVTAGELLEIHAMLDERHDLGATPVLRFDVLEEDFLLVGGLDDRVISLFGDGAVAPEPGAPVRQLARTMQDLPPGQTVAAAVEQFKRSREDYADALLVVRQLTDAARPRPGTRRTHVFAWHRVAHDDIGAHSELYAILDVTNGQTKAASETVDVAAAPLGVAIRLRGVLTDLAPLAAATPEPLPDVPVKVAGRRALSGADGLFVIDARLPVGDAQVQIARPGIDPVTLTVAVTATAQGVVTAAVRDAAGAVLVTATTPAPATEATVLTMRIPDPIAVKVHKVRGTLRWPDSLPGDVAADYLGTPLAERRVHILPLPATGTVTDHRPRTTAAWEALAPRADVLHSTRPGRPVQRERTAFDGRFEVKYVDLTAGNRFLVWVTRADPQSAADVTTEAPDHVVRAFRQGLLQLTQPDLLQPGRAGTVDELHRLLIDHEDNLTCDAPGGVAPPPARNVVAFGLDVWRVVSLPAPRGLTLVRPRRDGPAALEPVAAPGAGAGEEHAIPASRAVDGMALQVLPLVLVDEPADAQGQAARRARTALAEGAEAQFPDGFDAGAVRWALDTRRLANAIDLTAGAVWDPVHDPGTPSRAVRMLESTFVVRDQLGRGRRLGVAAARWHIDAVSLADSAFVQTPAVNGARARQRVLAGPVVPVLGAVSPLLPGLSVRSVYLMPGHGLWADGPNQASANAAHWISERGGYGANAGEDEVDALFAAQVLRIAAVNGAAGRTVSCREGADHTRPGVRNVNAAPWFVDIADPDFPRLWQQNAVYNLGRRGDAVVVASAALRAPAGNRNNAGANARVAQARGLAAAGTIDLIFASHTNASPPALAGRGRGTLVEYLNAEPAGGGAGEGNPLGLSLATHLRDRIVDRCHTGPGNVRTMLGVQGGPVGDLIRTFDHGQLENQAAGANSAQDRRVADGPLLPAGTPVPAPPAAATHIWRHNQFRDAGGAVVRVPVALSETAFHDNDEDAALLSRAWFRRLAGEAMAMGVEDQLRDDATALTAAEVRAVLVRVLGDTPAVAALPRGGAAATPATVAAALHTVADPGAGTPGSARLSAVVDAALAAARSLTRASLVALIRDELRVIAGWEDTDEADRVAHPDANDIDRFVTSSITGGAPLARPGSAPTRAEAGALACTAIGLPDAGLRAAETVGVGSPAAPLLRPAPVAPGTSAFLGRVEAGLIAGRLHTLAPQDVHRVADAWLADAAWEPADISPAGVYELDPGTPLVVVFRTVGAAWKTEHQADADRLKDVELRVYAPFHFRRLGCVHRDARLAASATWILDLPATKDPVDVSLDLFVRHRTAGMQRVGRKTVKVKVLAPA